MKFNTENLGQILDQCRAQGQPPLVKGPAGSGKVAAMKDWAQDRKLDVIDVQLSDSSLADLAAYVRVPSPNTPLPDGVDGWLVILDEMDRAVAAGLGVAYDMVVDRAFMRQPLHEKCMVAGACTQEPLFAPVVSRMARINIE